MCVCVCVCVHAREKERTDMACLACLGKILSLFAVLPGPYQQNLSCARSKCISRSWEWPVHFNKTSPEPGQSGTENIKERRQFSTFSLVHARSRSAGQWFPMPLFFLTVSRGRPEGGSTMKQDSFLGFEGTTCKRPFIGAAGDATAVAVPAAAMMMII